MKLHHFLLLFFIFFPTTNTTLIIPSQTPPSSLATKPLPNANNNETIYTISKQLCWNCLSEAIQFLFHHNLARASKRELPLTWDSQLESYAKWWAGKRKGDCKAMHSFPEDDFKLGENIYWGSGSLWTPGDAVSAWVGEEKYYNYGTNSCVEGQLCGHYTQIVWKSTRSVGCARVVCDTGDVFITCNYFPVGNYIGNISWR